MKRYVLFVSLLALVLFECLSPVYSAKVKVVTTTEDLADIARNVGGSRVSVVALAKGAIDPHMVEPRPSMVNQLRDADLFVRIGMDLDVWAQSLVDAARNKDIVYGAKGYVDASVGIRKLEVPTVKLDPSMGHIHIYGNPHYWLDPANGKVIARNVLQGLCRVSPSDKSYFEQNYREYTAELDKAIAQWSQAMRPFKGTKVVTYHKSFVYFLDRFGLDEFGNIEPKPGIPPSPAHVNSLIKRMKSEGVKLILMEPFYPKKFPEMIARETGAKLVICPSSVGCIKGVTSYIGLFDCLVSRVTAALR